MIYYILWSHKRSNITHGLRTRTCIKKMLNLEELIEKKNKKKRIKEGTTGWMHYNVALQSVGQLSCAVYLPH